MGEKVGEYFRLPITLIDDGGAVPWISVIDISGPELPFNTRLPISPEERDFLGDYGKRAELEAIKSMTEAEEG
jgi:hypothetical protein